MTDATPPTPETPATPPVPPAAPPAAAAPAAPAAGVTPPPAYAAPAPGYAGAPVATDYPGKTLGIVAIPVAIFFSLIGIILGFVARSQSKKAGQQNTPALIAIIIGFVVLIGTIIFWIVIGVSAASLLSLCAGMEPGTYTLDNGGTITCG